LNNLAYVIGIALGDGNLSNPNGRATRLRVTRDTHYPKLIEKISGSIQKLFPSNQVATVKMKGRCLNISCYSNGWERLLGWKANQGSKFNQKVRVPQWIFESRNYSIPCLRGLFESDGCVYNDRGYTMAMFTSIIPELAHDTAQMIISLGFKPHSYKIRKDLPLHDRYNVRISKNAEKFVTLVGIKKD